MKLIFLSVLLGCALARPEAGYSYPQQLSQGQYQAPQQLYLSQSQQNLPQPIAPVSPISQVTVQNLPVSYQPQQVDLVPPQQVNVIQTLQQDLSQIVSPQLPETPQLVQQQLPVITKHVYVHVAPEEPPLPAPVIPPPPPPKKSYKIIFVKVPSQATSQRQVIHVPAQQPAVEEKTLVYVLVDRPQQPEIVVSKPPPTSVSKPEVYFIKYKTSSAAVPAQSVAGLGGSLPAVEDVQKPQGVPISSGESISSLFSGPSSQYGPPGYQKKRNA